MSTGRNAALATLSIGGLMALIAWSVLIRDLFLWEAPRVAVVPPIAGTALPRVEVALRAAGTSAEQPVRIGQASQPPEPRASAAPVPTGASSAPSASPEAIRRLDAAMAQIATRLDAQREQVRARTTGTAPPQIPLPRDVVTCGGMRARGVERVAYLIDCSARSEPHIALMIDEVMRSIARLDDAQSFSVIACRKDWAEVAPPGAMRKAGSSLGSSIASDLRTWLRDKAAPGGNPQIFAGIEAAMGTRPDLVVLVSAGLANPGDGNDARDAALGAFDRANPHDARSGRRPARVMTLVAGGQDPGGVLASIASAHAVDARLHGTLSPPATARAAADASPTAPAPQGDLDARLIAAMRVALSDPADPASARALLEAAVIAETMDWPREHVARMARAAARRAESLGLDEIAAEANGMALRAVQGSAP